MVATTCKTPHGTLPPPQPHGRNAAARVLCVLRVHSRPTQRGCLLQHKSESIKLVADFLDIPLDDALEEVVVQQTSKESMAANLSKYDDHPLKLRVNTNAGLPADAGLGEVSPARRHPVP